MTADPCLCACGCSGECTVEEGFCHDCAMGVFGDGYGPTCGFYGTPHISDYPAWYAHATGMPIEEARRLVAKATREMKMESDGGGE